MRLQYPQFENKSDFFKYLKDNENILKKELISQKGHSDAWVSNANINNTWKSEKANVKLVANTFNWCDFHMDVLIPNCADKTIQERGNQIKHLADHKHTTEGIVGITEAIYVESFFVDGKIAQGIVAESNVIRGYNEKVHQLYIDNQIGQHSIGLQYVKLYLCINSDDPDYSEQKERYDKYYNDILNKEIVDNRGFFWAVTEIKLIEYSAVLIGSNSQTGCITRFSNAENELYKTKNADIEKKDINLENEKPVATTTDFRW